MKRWKGLRNKCVLVQRMLKVSLQLIRMKIINHYYELHKKENQQMPTFIFLLFKILDSLCLTLFVWSGP